MEPNLYRHCPESGFTIIELMLGVGLVAVLIGIGVPAYQSAVKNACLTSTTSRLVGSLQYARSEAVKRRKRIDLVAKKGGWDTGWAVQYSDSQMPEVVLRRFDKGNCDATTITAGDDMVTYRPDGALFDTTAVVFHVCDDRDNQQTSSAGREIDVAASGSVRTNSRYTGLDCAN